jgi:hypothetical protein
VQHKLQRNSGGDQKGKKKKENILSYHAWSIQFISCREWSHFFNTQTIDIMTRRCIIVVVLFLALSLSHAFLLPRWGVSHSTTSFPWKHATHSQSFLLANAPDQSSSAMDLQKNETTKIEVRDDTTSLSSSEIVSRASIIEQMNTKDQEESSITNRRTVLATALFGIGASLVAATSLSNLSSGPMATSTTTTTSRGDNFRWEVTPINKRTGVTVYDAEKAGYNLRFVTYLSRFLLSFDSDCQRWWYARAKELPRLASAEQITEKRLEQFAAFAASVEVGLQDYAGPDGPTQLLESLRQRYERPFPSLTGSALEKQQRQIQEARRQIALLFGLMEQNQPVQALGRLLAAIDNGQVGKVEIVDPGSGYAPGYGSPQVIFPPPDGGPDYERATGRAVLKPNGRLLRIDVVNRGSGYATPPEVTIAPPAAIRFRDDDDEEDTTGAEQAQAKAFLFRSGPNKGRIERIQLTNPGKGYNPNEIIKVRFSTKSGGSSATARAVLEYEVDHIEMTNNGTGYAVEKPLEVYVEPPPLTARVNMNDPIMGRLADPSSQQRLTEANRAACVGRGCYDKPVVAIAYPVAEKDSYSAYLSKNDTDTAWSFERSLLTSEGRVVSASAGRPPDLPSLGVASPISSSAQLLQLLPEGIGLEYNDTQKRYVLAIEPTYDDVGAITDWKSYKSFDPYFGPRGRTPIEKDMDLGIGTYLRFVASGAICCSAVHLALTPIDVVKTKVQTDPGKYLVALSKSKVFHVTKI